MVSMDLFRSEEMVLVQLIMPAESAHDTITYLAELSLLQFRDLNPGKSPFQRTYANQVKRYVEMSRKLRFFHDQVAKAGKLAYRPIMENISDVEELDHKLGDFESELLEINANNDKLQRSQSELMELKLVLQNGATLFHSTTRQVENGQQPLQLVLDDPSLEESASRPLLLEQEMQTEPTKHGRLGFITGVVPKAKALSFERILFRATRGNMYLKQVPIDEFVIDPVTGEKVEKIVFVVFFSGSRARTKITKICEAFGANRYPFPDEPNRLWQMKSEVDERLSELQSTLDAGIYHRNNVLNNIGYSLEKWSLMVKKEKAVYHTLNMLSVDVTRKCLVAEAWCPVAAKPKIQDALQRAAYDSNSQVNTIFQVLRTKESPPTFFETNKFTSAFQEIVDAYGVGQYQEANPGCFTIITFPFLFAVMFGDWGHGIALLVAALYLIINEKKFASKRLGDIMNMAYGGRYVILLMAIFSIYTGFIYNEFFSVPFEIFGKSAYRCRDPSASIASCTDASTAGLVKFSAMPYPFGVDPVWHGSRSELPFLNSMKMKMSILLGIAQMNLGIILSYFNAKFFHSAIDVWYQFIPQLLFLNALFGYLSFLIILKWCQGSKPDLYHIMIYMFLSPTDDLGENQLFWGQRPVQIVLLLLALVAVPWMLLPKPLTLQKQHLQKARGQAYGVLEGSDTEDLDKGKEYEVEDEEFEFSEVLVHQMIHTIEFVLGAVSNTASYLRLWALSLAHAQLSAVFYDRVLLFAWGYSNPVIRLVGLFVFASCTVGVLLIMETLSAFLHALRLHWVEFQNKFYSGDGYKFHPFSFSTLSQDYEDDT